MYVAPTATDQSGSTTPGQQLDDATADELWEFQAETRDWFRQIIRQRRADPGDGFVSRLTLARDDDGEPDAAAGFVHNAVLLPEILRPIALGRLGRPEEILGAVVYLLSDASTYTTGSLMTIDGGVSG